MGLSKLAVPLASALFFALPSHLLLLLFPSMPIMPSIITTTTALEIGDPICLTGYIMDIFCIHRMTLLDDPSVTTLFHPDLHSYHCLLDVDYCYESGYVILGDKEINENNPQLNPVPENEPDPDEIVRVDDDSGDDLIDLYCIGFRLDNTTHILDVARSMGNSQHCETCSNSTSDAPMRGYRATVRGVISELGDGGMTNSPEGVPLLTDLEILDESVGCGGGDGDDGDDSGSGGMTVPPLCLAGAPPLPVVTVSPTSFPTSTEEGGTNNADDSMIDCTQEMCYHQLSSDYSLGYKVNVPDGNTADECSESVECTITMELTYEGGEAWIGVGFSTDGRMVGGEAVIAIPGADGHPPLKYDLGGYSPDQVTPMSDDKQTLTEVSIESDTNDGITKMSFTKKLYEGDEIQIVPGDNTFIWAFGSSPTLAHHPGRGDVTVNVLRAPAPVAGGTPSPTPATGPPAAASPATGQDTAGSSVDCTQQFCTNELEPGLIQKYQINVPPDTTPDVCSGCSITMEITYDGEAWLAFGFSTNGQMVGSEAIIGIPGSGPPLKYMMTGKSPDTVTPMPNSQQTLTDQSIETSNGQTILKFTKFMDEPNEIPITTSNNEFLWAYGTGTSLGYHGGNRAAFALNLSSGSSQSLSTPNMSAWLAHGVMGFLAWGVFVPFAVQSSLLRGFLPKGPLWFHMHRIFNTTAYALFIALFAVAVAYTSKEGAGPGLSGHFDTPHPKMGLAMFVMAFLQILGGILRPHNPEAGEEKTPIRTGWEVGHRLLGVALLACGFWQIYVGIELYGVKYSVNEEDEDKVLIAYWVWVAVMCALILVGGVMRAKSVSSAGGSANSDNKSSGGDGVSGGKGVSGGGDGNGGATEGNVVAEVATGIVVDESKTVGV